MNTITARELAGNHSLLIEMVSMFQFEYGKDYMLLPGSPTHAWDLYQRIQNQQVALARLLDVDALDSPIARFPQWWKTQEVMDIGILLSIGMEINHLIAACACASINVQPVTSLRITTAQRVIAGMLHPGIRLMAQHQQMPISQSA
jgi:hypothetical protein